MRVESKVGVVVLLAWAYLVALLPCACGSGGDEPASPLDAVAASVAAVSDLVGTPSPPGGTMVVHGVVEAPVAPAPVAGSPTETAAPVAPIHQIESVPPRAAALDEAAGPRAGVLGPGRAPATVTPVPPPGGVPASMAAPGLHAPSAAASALPAPGATASVSTAGPPPPGGVPGHAVPPARELVEVGPPRPMSPPPPGGVPGAMTAPAASLGGPVPGR